MTPLEGIKIGVFVTKVSVDDENGNKGGNGTNGFIDKDAHRTFVENVFSTSPYNSSVANNNE